MSENISPEPNPPAAEDLDTLLEQEDPGFTQDLKAVSEVQPEGEIDDSTTVDLPDQHHPDEGMHDAQDLSRWQLLRARVMHGIGFQLQRLSLVFVGLLTAILVFLKTKPIEFLKYALSQIKSVLGMIGVLLGRFSNLSRGQKLLTLVVIGLSVAIVMLTLKNLKGVWIPTLNPPLVTSLSMLADESFVYSGQGGEMFYRAFPRDPDVFLLDKFKVNLKPSEGYPNPMGAFEVVLELDSKEAAVESQDRRIEMHDVVQREFEDITYPAIITDLGKQQLKNRIKNAVDSRLSQGWVEDVHFQTFILKP